MKSSALLIISCFCINCFSHEIQKNYFRDKKGRTISIAFYRPKGIDQQLLNDMRMVFMKSFSEAYKDIPLVVLGVSNVENFLDQAFAEEESIITKEGHPGYFVTIAHYNEIVAGFASFDTEDAHCYYIREVSMHPDFQHAGIGEQLILSAKIHDNQLYALRLMTRRANVQACNFYKKLGFVESSYVHNGIDPAKYVGYEKNFLN